MRSKIHASTSNNRDSTAAVLSREVMRKIGPSLPGRSLALTLISAMPPRWKRGRSIAVRCSERAVTGNGKCIANGAACKRGYRTDVICARPCAIPRCMRLRDRTESQRQIQLILHSQPRKFRSGHRRRTSGPRRDICEALLSR